MSSSASSLSSMLPIGTMSHDALASSTATGTSTPATVSSAMLSADSSTAMQLSAGASTVQQVAAANAAALGGAPALPPQAPVAPGAGVAVSHHAMQSTTTTTATNNQANGTSGPVKKKKPGRSPSQIWILLTDEPNPQRKNAAACKHCKQQVLYYKKSEQAIRHLKKCAVFQSNQHQYSFISQFQDVLPLYNQKINAKGPSRKRQKTATASSSSTAASTAMTTPTDASSAAAANAAAMSHVHAANAMMSQLGMNSTLPDSLMDPAAMGLKDEPGKEKPAKPERKAKGSGGGLSRAQQERFEEALAMHAYVTGMAFDAMEECHLQRALTILRPNVKIPEKKRLETDLLHRCYDKMHKRVWGYLTSCGTRVCIKRDGWTNMNLHNSTSPHDVSVTYMAVNNEKRFFLGSEKPHPSRQYDPMAIAEEVKRVMAPIVGNVCGVVTGSTVYHARAWQLLKAEYPTKFFYGCIAHALHLAIRDIFGPEKSAANDPRQMTPMWPMDFPFQELVEFTANCNQLLSFFSRHPYPLKDKSFDAQTVQIMKSFANTPAAMQWGTLGARFRVILQTEETIQSIVSDPEFIENAPDNQRFVRQSIKDFVMNLNWKVTLDKAISILTPIELNLYKFQDDKAPISEVYYESKHLLLDFDTVYGLSKSELEYVKKVVMERWQYVLSEAHGLAFLLDPRYIGKSMTREYREQIEELIFNYPESDHNVSVSEERKRLLSAEYTEYVIYAKNQRDNQTFKWEMLDTGNRSPLQFWMTDADDWPNLKSLALALFSLSPTSVASEKSLCKATLAQSSRRNKLHDDDMARLAFITINDSQFTNNRTGDFQNTLPDFTMNDTALAAEGATSDLVTCTEANV